MAGMPTVSTFRLYLLRASYFLLVVGLSTQIWPLILRAPGGVEHMRGVVWSMLTAVSLLALLGLRYPLAMLPLLFFELVWKLVWVLAVGLPLWSAGGLAGANRETFTECLVGLVIFPLVIPWRYVIDRYLRQPGDRWTGPAPST